MEARLISERNYWKNKYEKLKEENAKLLSKLFQSEDLNEVIRLQHIKETGVLKKKIVRLEELNKSCT
jgi:hypothetical protein